MPPILKNSIIFSAFAFTSVSSFSGPTNVPFQATMAIEDSIDLTNAAACSGAGLPGFIAGPGMTIGSGNASHLGRIAFVGNDCVSIIGGTPEQPVFLFSGAEGSVTITAANGDKLYGKYWGTFMPSGKPTTNGLVSYKLINGGFSISRGTGRFADAYASGDITGEEQLNLKNDPKFPKSHGTVYLSGKISY